QTLDARFVHARCVVIGEESFDASTGPVLAARELLEEVLHLAPVRLPGGCAPTPARELVGNGVCCSPRAVGVGIEVGTGVDLSIDVWKGSGRCAAGGSARRQRDKWQRQDASEQIH